MKYFVSATPGPMPPAPQQFDAATTWLEGKLNDGTFDCIFGFMEGGGFSVVNADSHHDVLELMLEYPLFGFVTWNVRPLMEFKGGNRPERSQVSVYAQAAMAAH